MIGVARHASGIVQAFQSGQPVQSDPAIQYSRCNRSSRPLLTPPSATRRFSSQHGS